MTAPDVAVRPVYQRSTGTRLTLWLSRLGWRHAVMWVVAAFAVFPVLFVVSAALNPVGTLSSSQLWPTGASLANARELFQNTPFTTWYANSLFFALTNAAVTVLLSALAAYAFSRMRFKGRRVGLIGLLVIQMFPQFLAIVAIYLMFSNIGEVYPVIGFDTRWGLLLVYLGGALSINTWLMKGFFDTVPRELDESAQMDGATHAQVFFRIMLPLVTPVLAIVALLVFINTINEFLMASVFLRDTASQTLGLGLYQLVDSQRNANFGMFAVGALMLSLPTLIVFWFLQRYISEGLTSGAVKG
ncbi:sugar ABC transporter permease [Nocardiopsis terrae]|uniref:Arabinogalactan oligomer/maltooligosaccharide transport system permease protein n=1 Tax=Nocardiopsis terrae TaxID=372655 RepID=A0ABR9HK13_9ACTN|nr:sugar ABC transporter permease [Nocardiopsis terrae]MBE1459363.1 arabinogalactan oligomer/maltooligosaccharide transport system permease protein [Nocardiopsis terrae]GHC96897.1 sugar ABC transporter permease [Nocardiopsis terrae]